MYYEKICCICNQTIDPREPWGVFKINWVLHKEEISKNAYFQIKCMMENVDESNFVMSHPLMDINLFVRTKWKGEFETTLNINYNQPMYVEGENLREMIEDHLVDDSINNHKIQLNFFMYFKKQNHFGGWFRNILRFLQPVSKSLLSIKLKNEKISKTLERIEKFVDFSKAIPKMKGLKRIKYNYNVYERTTDLDFQKCYTNKRIDKEEIVFKDIEPIYEDVVPYVMEKYKVLADNYKNARKRGEYKIMRIFAFEMEE
ncbi:hypothetical protein SCHIN_v1c07430 [Spiroplasma chinense]|uniref:Uncharacterized protein n=1 Tax=Spiroplasma chinense TaxID=216932 RepID=A0A5B9Y450_9MOLU|nr:hypothetical protein [Spiroplasma chinense]QEH61938.1 hypothetical protein SCHIN_v1c07430 [Spiroplasma chinense]